MENLNSQIKQRMSEVGMTQNELAAKAGLSVSYLSLLINGQRVWRLDKVEAVAHALGCALVVNLHRPKRDPF